MYKECYNCLGTGVNARDSLCRVCGGTGLVSVFFVQGSSSGLLWTEYKVEQRNPRTG